MFVVPLLLDCPESMKHNFQFGASLTYRLKYSTSIFHGYSIALSITTFRWILLLTIFSRYANKKEETRQQYY